MRADNAFERFHRATSQIRDEYAEDKWQVPPAHSQACAACGRPWKNVEDPNLCGVYQYSTSMAREYECSTCHTARIASPEVLGIEMYRGKNKVPSGGRLGMLPGCGGVITTHDELHLALNDGFYKKFVDGGMGRAGMLHVERPMALLLRMYAKGQLGNLADGIVFVDLWGRKPDVLMANLRLTRSLSEVWCCSEAGAECLDLASVIAAAKWLDGHGLGEKSTKPAFWKPVRDAALGKPDPKALQKWAAGIPDAQALVNLLPIDPHARLRLPYLMAMIHPYVAGGAL